MRQLIVFLLILNSGLSWSQTPIYKRIAIPQPNSEVLHILDSLGVDLECGAVYRNDSLQLELNELALDGMSQAGIKFHVIIDDMTAYYANRSANDLPEAREELEILKEQSRKKKDRNAAKNVGQHGGCEEIDWEVPEHFHLNPNNSPNSFGGCLTYDQVLQELDSMHTLFPHLISVKMDASPTNQTTLEGRTIYYVRISDNPDVDEPNEPETLYQSLIHSREAGSLMQLLYFMWYLLENYDADPSVKSLLNNQALYFIPVFNPDGFVYNELQSPDGGGMQRKNRNTFGGCTTFDDGIDLNRNSAYYWGNGGASSNNCSQTFLGTGPFSENETQIMRDFFLLHDFKLALNHHSYKNAMLHGYAGTTITNPRPDEYAKYSHDMTYYNRYAYGPSTSISSLNSGNMNDWMLGGPAGVSSNGTPTGVGSGKNTLAWTPENGTGTEGGFWPAPSNFVTIAQRAVRMNFLAAYFSGKYARLHDLTPGNVAAAIGSFEFGIENLGQTSSAFTVTLEPISNNIVSLGAPVVESGMAILEQRTASFNYILDPSIQSNDTVAFRVTVTNDYTSDSILYQFDFEKIFQPMIAFQDNPDADGLNNWSASGGGWVQTSNAYSGTTAITLTDTAPYANNLESTLELNTPLDFSDPNGGCIEFYTKWDLERSFDYVQFEASVDGMNWLPLCGKYSKPGAPDENNTYSGKSGTSNEFQPDGLPLYDGDSNDKWVKEEIAIDTENNSFLLGENAVQVRFHFYSETSNNQDSYYNANFEGFTFDDFTCYLKNAAVIGLDEYDLNPVTIQPNPAVNVVSIHSAWDQNVNVRVVSSSGQETVQFQISKGQHVMDVSDWSPGIYFFEVDGIQIYKLVKL